MSQRTRNIILWVIAIGLLVSMVISFTPGNLFGNGQQEAAEGPVALTVNGQEIRELEIQRLGQNPPFNAIQEGPAAQDLQLVLLDQLVSQTVLEQAAADVRVSSGEVRERVNEFREQQGVAGSRNDRAYQNLLAGAGYTDGTFRELTKQQIQQEKYLANLTTDAAPTDEEIETYYTANQSSYQSEPRITAREIVVAGKDEADALYARALTGADFVALARENSTERADQGGALGAAEGESAPKPVTSVALPTAVSQAAFALQGPGLTAPVQAGGAYHIVKVEGYTPAGTRPLGEVRSEVETDLTDLREAAAEEQTLRTLKAAAEISSPAGSTYSYKNPVVARVGDAEIDEAELDRNTYLNPQIQQLLNPNFAGIIANSVKPNVLTQMIDAKLAVQGSKTLDGTFVGPESAVAQSALGYVSRNVKVNDAQVKSFYEENRANYTEPPSALTTRVNFPDAAAARNFRQALTTADTIDTESISLAAEAAGGTSENLGTVVPEGQPGEIDTVLFDFEQGMTALGQSGFDISRVLTLTVPAAAESGGGASGGAVSGGAASGGAAPATEEQFVILVAARTPERVRPLAEVRAQVRQAALQQRRNDRQQEWLSGLREQFPVENLLASAAAAAGGQSGGAASGGAAGGATPNADAQDNADQGNATQDDTTQGGGPILTPTPVPEPESGAEDEGANNEGTQNEADAPNAQPNTQNAQDTQGEPAQNSGNGAADEAPAQPQNNTQNNTTQDAPQNEPQNTQEDTEGAEPGQTDGAQQGTEQNGVQNSAPQNSNAQGSDYQNNNAQDNSPQNNAAPGKETPAEAAPKPQGAQPTGGAAQGGQSRGSQTRENNAQEQGAQNENTAEDAGGGAQQTQPETQNETPQSGAGDGAN